MLKREELLKMFEAAALSVMATLKLSAGCIAHVRPGAWFLQYRALPRSSVRRCRLFSEPGLCCRLAGDGGLNYCQEVARALPSRSIRSVVERAPLCGTRRQRNETLRADSRWRTTSTAGRRRRWTTAVRRRSHSRLEEAGATRCAGALSTEVAEKSTSRWKTQSLINCRSPATKKDCPLCAMELAVKPGPLRSHCALAVSRSRWNLSLL